MAKTSAKTISSTTLSGLRAKIRSALNDGWVVTRDVYKSKKCAYNVRVMREEEAPRPFTVIVNDMKDVIAHKDVGFANVYDGGLQSTHFLWTCIKTLIRLAK